MFKRRRKSKGDARLDTLIGQHTQLEGDILFAGGLRVEGYIKGDVTAQGEDSLLTVSIDGAIEGQVKVPYVILSGAVTGDVHASEYIELAPQAQVDGNVYYRLIEMARGAKVNGNLVPIEEQPISPLELTSPLEVETKHLNQGLTESKAILDFGRTSEHEHN